MKTSTLKRLLALVACLVMVFALFLAVSACNDEDPYQEQDDLLRDEEGNIIFTDAQGNPTKLKVWSVLDDPDYTYQVQVNRAFNDYYRIEGIQAEITSVNVGRYYTQLANVINTDPENAPDVVIFHSERLTNMASDNILVPMTKYLNMAEVGFSANNYLENVMAECYYNNEVYAVPIDVHSGVWFVREDVLTANGLSKPTNMDEFVAVCNALIEKNNAGTLKYRRMEKGEGADTSWQTGTIENFYPVSMSADNGIQNGWIPQTAIFQNGGVMADANGMPGWGNVQGFNEIMGIFRDWQRGEGSYKGEEYAGKFVWLDDRGGSSVDNIWSDLSKCQSIFVCEGPWRIETQMNMYKEVFGDDSGLSVMGLSGLYTTNSANANANKVYGVGHCVGVVKTVTSSTKRVAAALYAKFMTEECADYMKGGHLPACKTVLNSNEYKESEAYNRYLKYMGDPNNFVMLGNTKNYSEVYEGLKRVYNDIFTLSKATTPVTDIIRIRYEEAIDNINSFDDL